MRGGYVVDLYDLDRSQVAVAGGKGANLGELSRIDGVEVPAGFCVTTAAFQQGDITAAVAAAVGDGAYAVRSSATAEDLPTASFAGQQDTYLNVSGVDSIVEHVKKCWESLYTERAVAYRKRNGIDERSVRMAVVVQRMVAADVSGVLFTADPVSGDRRVSAVEAVAGLGEQLVSGRVNADHYRVRDGVISGEGTVLNPVQLRRLVDLGRRIEAHFGSPQDIEWCLAGDDLFIVQSRPITTLFPIPEVGDQDRHVYVSVGHQQMMTDAMKPLGHSMWRLTAMAPMHEAGGRLFVDIAARLADPAIRPGLLDMMGKGDPVIRDALETLLERDGVTPSRETMPVAPVPDPDPAIIERLIARSTASIEQLRHDISEKSGAELFDFLDDAFAEHKRVLADRDSFQALMAGMGATWWLNDRLAEWLGETNAADTLTLSAPGNITSEMGLELLDVADVIREHPEVETADVDDLPGEVREVLAAYLDRYGMRCVGEIDITRPRWSEQPGTLLPVLLDAVRNFRPGESRRRFEQGRERAAKYAADILVRLRSLPDGVAKADETERMIARLRNFIGYREYPKYDIVCRYLIYKRALMAEAALLPFADTEDAFFLTYQELRDAVRTKKVDQTLIRRRKDEFRHFQTLRTPRILTSDGEMINGSYRRDDLPPGALAGLPVSAGTVEGRARVVRDLADADFAPGDILVTAFTDPSWTPALVTVAGLVTEVGGQMTHGAVIAREYGLPAVVGVENATSLIEDGQRIRVHGTEGYVETV